MKRAALLTWILLLAMMPAAAQFTITTVGVPNATIGEPYPAVEIETTGGIGPLTWSFTSAQAPPLGFVIGPASTGNTTLGAFCWGVITTGGQPNCIGNVQGFRGTYLVTLRAQDAEGNVATRQFTLILEERLSILTDPVLPEVIINQSYNFQLTAAGGTGNYSWSLADGALPPGIGLLANGILTGTAPSTGNTFRFVIQVTDVVSGAMAIRQFELRVLGGLRITTTAIPLLVVGEAIEPFQFTAEGAGNNPLVWSIPPGWTLPVGLSLSASGLLTGAGIHTGTTPVQVRVEAPSLGTADQHLFTIHVTRGVLRIVETELPVAAANTFYETTLTVAGGLPPYAWNFGTVRTHGLSIHSGDGTITGTPTETGNFPLPVVVTDATGTRYEQLFRLLVTNEVTITTASFATQTVGVPVDETLRAVGGQPPYRWEIIAGNLPTGLTLDAVLGRIQGTPEADGVFQFTLRVTDFGQRSATRQLSMIVGDAIRITTGSLDDAVAGEAYSFALQTSGGASPLHWRIVSASGTGPVEAFAIDPVTGVLTGTAPEPATITFLFEVSDAAQKSAQRELTLIIAARLRITSGPTPRGGQGAAYSFTPAVTGGRTPYRWSLAGGSLPPGLAIDASTGAITGTPTTLGTFPFTLEVADAGGQSAQVELTIAIGQPLTITTGDLTVRFGERFERTLAAAGGVPPYSWSITSGTPGPGISFDASSATLEGTPEAVETRALTFRVRDQEGQSASKTIQVTVLPPALPELTIVAPATAASAQQITVGVRLAEPYPIDVGGTLQVEFESAVGGTDDMVRFARGGRSAEWVIPAGSTDAAFVFLEGGGRQTGDNPLLTGTVAGTLGLAVVGLSTGGPATDPGPGPTAGITVERAVPAISGVTMRSTGSGVEVVVTGYTNTREMADGSFVFSTSGSPSQVTVTVPLSSAFAAWFQNEASHATGGQFRLTLPFTITPGATVNSVAVTLRNAIGASAARSSN